MRVFSTQNLDVGAKNNIEVYDLLQCTSNKSQIAFSGIFDFFSLRVSRVSPKSAEKFRIVFLQLLEESLHLTKAIIFLKAYCW
jgi:hypothetical protein